MTVAYASFVLGIIVLAAIGLLVAATTPTQADWLQNILGRLGRIRDLCVDELGRYWGALVVLLAGSAAAVIVCWPFGRLARRFERHIDVPVLNWTLKHFRKHGSFEHLNAVLTKMGNSNEIQVICLVAAVIFA